MICPHCNQETEIQEPERVTNWNWLPVWIGGVEYTAVDWGIIKHHQWYGGRIGRNKIVWHYAPSIPLLFVERID